MNYISSIDPQYQGTATVVEYDRIADVFHSSYFSSDDNLILKDINLVCIDQKEVKEKLQLFLEMLRTFLTAVPVESKRRLPNLKLSRVDDESYSLKWQARNCISEFIFSEKWDDSFWVLSGKRGCDTFSESGDLKPDRFLNAISKSYNTISENV